MSDPGAWVWCMTEGEAERACVALAERQSGVISLEQALGLKMGRRLVKSRVDGKRWLRIFPGVYRVRGAPESWRAFAMAALLWAGEESALSHQTAAAVWRIDGFREQWPIHITSCDWLKAPAGINIVVHTHPKPEHANRNGLRITSIERTLIDLADLPLKRLERALDDALVQQLTTAGAVLSTLTELGRQGRAGAGVLQRLVELRTGYAAADSHLETKLMHVLHRAKLPIGEQQVAITDNRARLIAVVDFAYFAEHVIIQCEGYRWHGGRRQFDQDLRTRALLEDAGWQVLHVTHRDVTTGVDELVARLRRRLNRR